MALTGDSWDDRIYIIIILSKIHREWGTYAYKIDVSVYMCGCVLTWKICMEDKHWMLKVILPEGESRRTLYFVILNTLKLLLWVCIVFIIKPF